MSKFVRLLHIIDSSIPTGAFAYSYGLETAINLGYIKNTNDLKKHLYSFLQQCVSFEFPFINSCYALIAPYEGEELKAIIEEYDAMILVPAINRASVIQGKNWTRLLESFYPDSGINELGEYLTKHHLPTHFIFILTLRLKKIEVSLDDILSMFLHMALRDQISASIRLGLLGPMEGHRLQHEFYVFFEEMICKSAGMDYSEAYKSAFLLDTFQILHEDIYSKLFQN